MGLQQKEDVVQRLIDVWSTGEASASLGFAAARLFDIVDPLEKIKDKFFADNNITANRAQLKALAASAKEAIEYLELKAMPCAQRPADRFAQLENDPMVQFALLDAQANVFCPACKLWNTGYGATMMREAVSLMGGYGVTEDCPGFLGHKWMDAQLEATYEGPEAVQRRQLTITMVHEVFLAQFQQWINELRVLASRQPGSGACSLATAMQLWLWTINHLQKAVDADGAKLYHGTRHGVTFPLADALCWLLSARSLILDVQELNLKGKENPALAEGLPGLLSFYADLCHVQSARTAGEVGRICSELVYGFNRHPAWENKTSCQCCYGEDELDALEGIMPGMASTASAMADVIYNDGKKPFKAGPCAHFNGYESFVRLRLKLDECLTGSRLAKDRAADALTKVMIPEVLDYPQ